jgi:uncharacterized surface protein with fasciclin (FAS1) repeats
MKLDHRHLITLLCLTAQTTAQTLDAVLADNTDLSSFRTFLSDSPDLLSDLNPLGDVTVLAWTNSALARFGREINASTSTTPRAMTDFLSYHILDGRFETWDIPDQGAFYPTLLPREGGDAQQQQVVFAYPSHANEVGTSGVFVFVSGYNNISATANENDVSNLNVPFDGGVVHAINAPLTLPPSLEELGGSLGGDVGAFVELGAAAGFDVGGSGEGEGLDGDAVTYLAPSNEAFRLMWAAVEEAGLEEDARADFLAELWAFHVVGGDAPLYTSRLENDSSIADDLTCWVQGDREADGENAASDPSLWIGNARVAQLNWLLSDGVLHVLDAVLNPDNLTMRAPAVRQENGTVAFEVEAPVDELPFLVGDGARTNENGIRTTLPGKPLPTFDEQRPGGLAVESTDRSGGAVDDGEDAAGGEGSADAENAAVPLRTGSLHRSAMLAVCVLALLYY